MRRSVRKTRWCKRYDLDETIRNMKEEYGRKVSVDEVADRMQISEDDVADILKLAGEEVEEEEE